MFDESWTRAEESDPFAKLMEAGWGPVQPEEPAAAASHDMEPPGALAPQAGAPDAERGMVALFGGSFDGDARGRGVHAQPVASAARSGHHPRHGGHPRPHRTPGWWEAYRKRHLSKKGSYPKKRLIVVPLRADWNAKDKPVYVRNEVGQPIEKQGAFTGKGHKKVQGVTLQRGDVTIKGDAAPIPYAGPEGQGPLVEVWRHGVGAGASGYILWSDINQAEYVKRTRQWNRRHGKKSRRDPALDKEMRHQRRVWRKEMAWYGQRFMPGMIEALKQGTGRKSTGNGTYKLDTTAPEGQRFQYEPHWVPDELCAHVHKLNGKVPTPSFAQWDVPWGHKTKDAVLCYTPADGGDAPNVLRFVNRETETFVSKGVTFTQNAYWGKHKGGKPVGHIIWLYGTSEPKPDSGIRPATGWVMWKSRRTIEEKGDDGKMERKTHAQTHLTPAPAAPAPAQTT